MAVNVVAVAGVASVVGGLNVVSVVAFDLKSIKC